MAKLLYLLHNDNFDLVKADSAPEGQESLGAYTVLGMDGEEERSKFRFTVPGNDTVVELPDDYDDTDLQAVTHLVQTLMDRHSDKVIGVYCETDLALATKIAAFMGAKVFTAEEMADHKATAVVEDEETPSADASAQLDATVSMPSAMTPPAPFTPNA